MAIPPRTLYMLVVCEYEYVIYIQTTKTGMKNITTILDDTIICGSGVASPIFDSFRSNKITQHPSVGSCAWIETDIYPVST